ncbi:hypothetical protein BJ742DRAFT_542580 [Cladochytrium replicatum]|nr:hypothetical protein BJ742DRAFT_542580 [Cladochytrium replicatum]
MSDTPASRWDDGKNMRSQEDVVSSPSGNPLSRPSSEVIADPNLLAKVSSASSPTILSPAPAPSKLAHFFGTLAHKTSWTITAKRKRDSIVLDRDEVPPPPASSETPQSNNLPMPVTSTRIDPSNPSRPPRLTSTPLVVEDLPSPLSLPPIANPNHNDDSQESSNRRNFGELDLPPASLDSRSHTSSSYVTTEEPAIEPVHGHNEAGRDPTDPTDFSDELRSSDSVSEVSASDVFLAQRRRELKGKERALFEFYEEITEIDDSDRDDLSGSNLSPEASQRFRVEPAFGASVALAGHTETYVDERGTTVTGVLTGTVVCASCGATHGSKVDASTQYELRTWNAASQTIRNRDVEELEEEINSSIQATPEQMYTPAASFPRTRESGRNSNSPPEEATSVIEMLPPSAVENADSKGALPVDKALAERVSLDHDASATVPQGQKMSADELTAVNSQPPTEALPVNQSNRLERSPVAINTTVSDAPLDPGPKPSKVRKFLCIPLNIFRGRHIRPKSKPSPGPRVSVPIFNPPPPPSHPPPQANIPSAQPQTPSSRRKSSRNEPVPSFEEILPMNMTLKMSATPRALQKSEEARFVDFQTPSASTPRTSTSSSRRKSLFDVFMTKQIRRMQGLEDLKQPTSGGNWIIRRLTRSSTIIQESPDLSSRTSKATEASLNTHSEPGPVNVNLPKLQVQKEEALQMIQVGEPEKQTDVVSPNIQPEEQKVPDVLPAQIPRIATQIEAPNVEASSLSREAMDIVYGMIEINLALPDELNGTIADEDAVVPVTSEQTLASVPDEEVPIARNSGGDDLIRRKSSGRKRKQDHRLSASRQKRMGRYLADAPVRPSRESDDEQQWSVPETARVALEDRKREKRWGGLFAPAPKEQ